LKTRQFYGFGDFRLDATAKVLMRNGQAVRLTPKAIETLIVLASHPDQVLTKNELIEAIWKDRIVDEANLLQNIAVVRKSLGRKPGEPGYIETFPGRGYRLLGPVMFDEDVVLTSPPHGAEPDLPAVDSNEASEIAEATVAVESPELAPMPQPAQVPPSLRNKFKTAWSWVALATLIVALVATGGLLSSWHKPPQALTRTPVVRLDGKEYQSAISPDGKDVAFVVDRGDGEPPQIVVKLADHSQPLTISQTDRECSSPAWSPDGKSLAFLRFGKRDGELVIAARDGSNERVLTHVFKPRRGLFYHHLSWAPDGRLLALDDAKDPNDAFSIFVVSSVTGVRTQITITPTHYIGDVEPRFSPDSQRISFIRVVHRSGQNLLVANADGSHVRELTDINSQVSGQDWSADGRSLVFAANRNGEFRLWRVDASQPGAVAVPDNAGIFADAPLQISLARAAPVLLYSILRQDFNIWRLDLDSREGMRRWKELINSSAQDASPQYSPDGKEICFRSDRSGDEQLWIANADGGDPQPATSGNLSPSVGRWSPDGRSIVFNNSRDKQVYVATREKQGKWSVRGLGVLGVHPVFSSDGRWVYLGRNDPAMEAIFKVPVAGGPITVVSRSHGLSFGMSRDGRYLYFVKERTDTTLQRLSLATGEITQALSGLLPYCGSCWAEGSGGIYYFGTDDATAVGQAILFHSFKSEPDRVVAEYPEPLYPIGSGPFSISPDGRYMLCVRMDSSRADVTRAEPFQ
jgi:Tol biopolymer transport system component/DNA-binding winged helix-turn-helix (wHTH) protein